MDFISFVKGFFYMPERIREIMRSVRYMEIVTAFWLRCGCKDFDPGGLIGGSGGWSTVRKPSW